MRLRNNPQASNILNNSNYIIKEHQDTYFNDNKPLHLEIGVGKGDFIIGMALKYPDINFIGIEKYASVLVKALDKLERLNISNVMLMNIDAQDLLSYFKQASFKTIYLNFSDPWPKKRHYKRRLTYATYLALYQKILQEDGLIRQKTDNKLLFESSLISYNNYGMLFKQVSVDLHNSEDILDNVMSEYEKKFSQTQPIYAISVSFKKGCYKNEI
ncbi:MAG: tRNA (guanosine(46)-N7)-methyltransferase TrmB [Bacilli bacterium]|nr:tRNA (guanosine(46)-N7)-methyltransferase TrmB [Bacilli bacterium]